MLKTILSLTVVSLLSLGLFAEDKPAEEKEEVKISCPVSGKPIKKEHSVDYRGAKVYFCCPNCPKAFTANTEKFATAANHQLVATGQATQKKCPFTGGKLNPETQINVEGAKVAFCCKNCLGKAQKLEGKEQVEAIFNDKAFDKGFEVNAKTKAE